MTNREYLGKAKDKKMRLEGLIRRQKDAGYSGLRSWAGQEYGEFRVTSKGSGNISVWNKESRVELRDEGKVG